ncbi:BlaI/MecI/CopY family transcriptional regulator [Streptomyces sp. ISL-11]|uniref:BlaI/MecI/CopY family transcriptional regulator n=1 Tax=Streptomyces sp. ISL-11 TaxID=2819174 RepID=UPI001BE65B19|nr:BlaI/MecI/CopY family transcriptional regulator [Streptomyces sp. ISL-11]MBT2387300.1 BlaI/MecI/CopY family transcriptional regulator [Streptomyces sp. ISL-11]
MTDTEGDRRPAGELEASVLAALWAAGQPLTAARVREAISMPLARTTVATILARLFEKGTIGRQEAGRGFAYFPTQDAHGLTARRMHRELDQGSDRTTVLARFVDQLSAEDEEVLRGLLEGDGR